MKEEISKFINQSINDSRQSINQIEKDSGVSKTIIYKILRGENYNIDSLNKLCVHLGVSIFD